MASSSEVRVGLVGVGAVPQTAHLPILSKMRGAQLVALCDNDGAKARALGERFGGPAIYTDIEDLLELEQLDAVIIATPNHLHEPHVLAALRAGVHVLCGRPLALSVRGAVPGLDADGFRAAAEDAKTNCPVSQALASVPEITLDADLL